MARFSKLEERLVQTVHEFSMVTETRINTAHLELLCIKEDMNREIWDQVNTQYAQWEASLVDTHAKYMSVCKDITQKMQEMVKMHDKAKDMVRVAYEVRNKYNLAVQESSQNKQHLKTTIKHSNSKIEAWEEQMLRNGQILAQIGSINTLLQSVEARQTDMEQVKLEAKQMQTNINQT